MAKMNGAVGNYNAHLSAWPDFDWEAAPNAPCRAELHAFDYALDLATKASRKLMAIDSEGVYVAPGYLAFVRDGNLMAAVTAYQHRTGASLGESKAAVEAMKASLGL